MIDAKTTTTMRRTVSSKKNLILAIILVILFALGLYGYNAFGSFQNPHAGPAKITQATLEDQYGLRVQLLAVTAAGGLVDLRLQIVDAEKAKALLDDSANLPALLVGDDVVLRTSENAAAQDIQFEDGKSIFVMFPNTGNILKPGALVNIIFGDFQLEAIQSK